MQMEYFVVTCICIKWNIATLTNCRTTVELQWLEHIWDYENLFETGVVRAIEGLLQSQGREA